MPQRFFEIILALKKIWKNLKEKMNCLKKMLSPYQTEKNLKEKKKRTV